MDRKVNKKLVKEIISWVMIFVFAFVLAKLISTFIIHIVEVPSGSMLNTIEIDDRIISSRLSYKFSEPKRGDIIVFLHDPEGTEIEYIKRLMGLPGETIEAKDGIVYIDGEPLNETYLLEPMEEDFGPITIPEDGYFVMGDNRNNSADARGWVGEKQFIKKNQIISKAFFNMTKFKSYKRPKYSAN